MVRVSHAVVSTFRQINLTESTIYFTSHDTSKLQDPETSASRRHSFIMEKV